MKATNNEIKTLQNKIRAGQELFHESQCHMSKMQIKHSKEKSFFEKMVEASNKEKAEQIKIAEEALAEK